MIDDPIRSTKLSLHHAFDEITREVLLSQGETFFIVLDRPPYLILADSNNGWAIWGTCPAIGYRFFSDSPGSYATDVTCEEFMDHIRTNYPDHFDWFLFNPEWLQ